MEDESGQVVLDAPSAVPSLNYTTHKLPHGLSAAGFGGLSATALGEDVGRCALSAGSGAIVGEVLGEGMMKISLKEGEVIPLADYYTMRERVVFASQVGACLATGMLSTAMYEGDDAAAYGLTAETALAHDLHLGTTYADIAVRYNCVLPLAIPVVSYGATALNALGATLAVYSGVEAAKKDGAVSGVITGATDAALMVVGGKLVPVVVAHMADGVKLFTQAGRYLGKAGQYVSSALKGRDAVKVSMSRPLESPHYSVIFRAELERGLHYPGQPDPIHFREANRQLYEVLRIDQKILLEMERQYPGIFNNLTPSVRGNFPVRLNSEFNLTWHHDAYEAGILDLIPRTHHKAPGIVQKILHPNNRGGMQIWGGGFRKNGKNNV